MLMLLDLTDTFLGFIIWLTVIGSIFFRISLYSNYLKFIFSSRFSSQAQLLRSSRDLDSQFILCLWWLSFFCRNSNYSCTFLYNMQLYSEWNDRSISAINKRKAIESYDLTSPFTFCEYHLFSLWSYFMRTKAILSMTLRFLIFFYVNLQCCDLLKMCKMCLPNSFYFLLWVFRAETIISAPHQLNWILTTALFLSQFSFY